MTAPAGPRARQKLSLGPYADGALGTTCALAAAGVRTIQRRVATSTSAPLTDEPQKVWLEFSPAAALFKIPENSLAARVAEGEVTIDDVALDVFYVD